MEKGSALPVGLTQLRGIVAILQWWGFNLPVIIMNKWIFQVALQFLVWKKSFDCCMWLPLIPIVGGIVLTFVMKLNFNMAGFLAPFFGGVVTSTKTILAESLLHGYNFDSINTVYYMSPYGTMILALPALLFEGGGCCHVVSDPRILVLALVHHLPLDKSVRILSQFFHLLHHSCKNGGDIQCSKT